MRRTGQVACLWCYAALISFTWGAHRALDGAPAWPDGARDCVRGGPAARPPIGGRAVAATSTFGPPHSGDSSPTFTFGPPPRGGSSQGCSAPRSGRGACYEV